MGFFFPKISWKPKDIKGTIKITEVTEVKKQPPIIVTQNIRDNFQQPERDVIDDYLTTYLDVIKNLDDIEKELDSRLDDISISYDPEKYPLLHEAHICFYCGNDHTLNTITYDDIKKHRDGERALHRNIMKSVIPDDYGNMSPKDVASHQEQAYKQMQSDMLDQVWRQILIWVLEMILNIVSPLRYVPMAESIPKKIEQWIEELKGNKIQKNTKFTIDAEKRKKQSLEDYDKSVGNNNNLYSLGGISRICAIHHRDFNNQLDNLVDGTDKEVYIRLRDVNSNVKDQVAATDDLTSVVIPDQYEYPDYNTSGLKYINNRPEAYLKARQDGKGITPSFIIAGKKGTAEVLKNTKKKWVNTVKNVLTNWWESPDTLCCIINNILKLAKVDLDLTAGRDLLLMMRAALVMYRNLLMFSFKTELAELFNLITTLVNGVLIKLIAALASMLKDRVNFDWLAGLKVKDSKCLPWNELLDTLGIAVKFFTEEFFSMLMDFIDHIQLINIKAQEYALKAQKVLQIDKWIALIDSVLGFMKVMQFCVINASLVNDGMFNDDYIKEAKAFFGPQMPDENLLKNVQNIQKSATIYKGGAMFTQITPPIIEAGGSKVISLSDSNKVTWAMDKESMKILLTNYIGLSEVNADAVVDKQGDCACDKSLTDSDLIEIKKALLHRSENA